MKINWKQVAMFAAAGGLFVLVANLVLKPDTIDWVNVALVPELAEELGVDLATRLELAHLGYLALDGIKGPPGTPTPAGKQADAYGRGVLERFGQQSFDLLSVPQRKQFYYMFREREVRPVKYHTEPPPSGSGPAMYWLQFGWKKIDASMHASLPETEKQLQQAWQIIPSAMIAESLVDHDSSAVSAAANRWLREHAPPPQQKKRKLSGPYAEDKWARHDRTMAEARRRVERAAQDLERERESRPSYEQRVARMRNDHEKRVTEMHREHEQRAAEMRRRHEERVREMKERRN